MSVDAGQTGAMAPPVALFVLGMFRSGTSALTRVLSLCGGTLPASLVGARVGNPLGHWEPRAANYLNESILHRHGSSVFDPSLRLQEEDAFTAEENAACIAEIRGFLTTLPVAPLVVIKDPKITVLPDQWFEAARLAGFNIAVAITVRHPQEVMSSVAALNKTSPELSGALWLKYTLMAERRTRDLPRVFVDYANLLDDWRREVERVSAALAIDLTTRDEDAIDAFLAPDLRHTRHCGPVTDVFGTDWMPATYEALRAAARDEPLDEPALDRVFDAYRTSEHAFRVAFEDFRDHHNGVLFRPSIRKLVNEVVAKTHLEGVLARPSVSKLAHEIRRW